MPQHEQQSSDAPQAGVRSLEPVSPGAASKDRQTLLGRWARKAIQEPGKAFAQGWYRDPEFCRRFFDLCEDEAFRISESTVPLAIKAVELAAANGDRCLMNESEGVLAHAFLSRSRRLLAGWVLDKNRPSAIDCCSRCRSGYLRRLGDLRAEERRAAESLEALNDCLTDARGELRGDALGRVLFPRSVAHHFGGHRGRALDDAGRVLELLSLDSPMGFFVDTPACMAVYLRGGDPCHDDQAVEILDAFTARISGLDGWKPARTRVSWVVGHVLARQGKVSRAYKVLKSAAGKLLHDGLPREIVAVVLDIGQLKCRTSNLREDNVEIAREWIKTCLDHRDDLPPEHRRVLTKLRQTLRRHPRKAFDELGAFRSSFVAPVPGLLGERIGPE